MIDYSFELPNSKTKIVDCHDERSIQTADNISNCSQALIMTRYEADHIIQSLKSFPLEEIGSSEFMHMYAYQVERLSLQAHASACMIRSNPSNLVAQDEFVIESILNFEKLPILVQTLLSVELWRIHTTHDVSVDMGYECVSFLTYLASHGNTLRLSFILHVETTLVSLLTLILFWKSSCKDMDNDTAIALADYCSRQMTHLITPISVNDIVRRQKEPLSAQDLAKKLENRSSLDGIHDNVLDTNYKTSVAATCLARYLCEYIDYLPLGAQTRILNTHDFLMMFIPLIDEPPWTRRRQVQKSSSTSSSLESTMIWEKFMESNEWKEVLSSKLLQVTKYEAQCWLSIFHLISSNASRQQYEFNTFRKDQLLRLRKFLNEVTIDQIPVLADVMHFMDQLSIMAVPNSSTGVGSAFLLQEVDKIRESLFQGKNWESIYKIQIDTIFSQVQDMNDPDLRLIGTIYDEDNYAAVVEGQCTHTNNICQPIDLIRLRCYCDGWKEVASLTLEKEFSVMNTPVGCFRRSKLRITYPDEQPVIFSFEDKVEAGIYFGGAPPFAKTLLSEELGKSISTTKIHSRKKVWCQLGSLDEQIILQFGLMPIESDSSNQKSGYFIDQAFFSQPNSAIN